MSFHVHDLTIGPAGPQTPTVIAVHGITGNGLNWTLLAELLGERFGPGGVRLLAPDLRGRGDSSIGPGPLGLAVHVQDLYTLARCWRPHPEAIAAAAAARPDAARSLDGRCGVRAAGGQAPGGNPRSRPR
jgi:pimeloyl-ACP methyl ester carboxylesterase